MKQITTFKSEFDNYVIVSFEQDNETFYGAVKDEYITDGKLNRQLNGLQMHMHKELNEVLEALQMSLAIKRIMRDCKCTMQEAFGIYLDTLED